MWVKGEQINVNAIGRKNIFWTVPNRNSLINISTVHGAPISSTSTTDTYTEYEELNQYLKERKLTKADAENEEKEDFQIDDEASEKDFLQAYYIKYFENVKYIFSFSRKITAPPMSPDAIIGHATAAVTSRPVIGKRGFISLPASSSDFFPLSRMASCDLWSRVELS